MDEETDESVITLKVPYWAQAAILLCISSAIWWASSPSAEEKQRSAALARVDWGSMRDSYTAKAVRAATVGDHKAKCRHLFAAWFCATRSPGREGELQLFQRTEAECSSLGMAEKIDIRAAVKREVLR